MSESSWNRHHHRRRLAGVETRPASARKLVSALWHQLDKGGGAREADVGWDAEEAARRISPDHHHRRCASSLELSNLSRRKNEASEGDGERSRHDGRSHGHWFSDAISNGGTTMKAPRDLASPYPSPSPSGVGMAQLQQELYNSMTASKELVRVLANVLPPNALNPTAASLLVALRSELDVARARARQLAREQRRWCGGDEVSAEEMRAWKSRHREKAARAAAAELDAERRARQRAERVSKKLGEALADAEASLREARRELERERKARERLESEGEEELRRREAERATRKMEREREMLRLADELREERDRMKLEEARLLFEEKNAVVDRLRQELEAFLLGRDDKDVDGREHPARDDEHYRGNAADDRPSQLVQASEPVVNGIDHVAVHENGEDGGVNYGCGGEAGDGSSDGSDDIELNMDGNDVRDYSWSHSTAAVSKATTTTMTARNAASSGSSLHGSFSDDRGTDEGEALPEPNWNDDQECSDENDDRATTNKEDVEEEDAERYEAIKNLREQMLAGHGFDFLSQQGGGAADHAGDGDRDRQRHPGSSLCRQVGQAGLW